MIYINVLLTNILYDIVEHYKEYVINTTPLHPTIMYVFFPFHSVILLNLRYQETLFLGTFFHAI